MTQISAADQHVITVKDGKWRLAYQDTPLAEGSEKGFRYGSRFGQTRRLPDTGLIFQEDIQQVILGWQAADESWHLGLILKPQLADQRGSRWCEIVHWPDPDVGVFQDLAQESGQHLAQALGMPFYVIPPQREVAPPAPARELPKLPLRVGHWQMDMLSPDQGQLIIRRTSSWTRQQMMKALWYGLWSIIYLVLSLATIFSDIALPVAGTLLPNPQVLPYIGVLISIGLVIRTIYELGKIMMSIDRIVIDGERGAVSSWNGKKMRWVTQQVELHSVYVSEKVKKRSHVPETEYGELNLHLGGGEFQFVINHDEPEEDSKTPAPDLTVPRTEGIRELDRNLIHTDLQAMAMYIAEALSPQPTVWYDLRVK